VKGLVRLDYFPFWYAAALAFEPAREALLRVTSEALRQTPEFRHAVADGEVQAPSHRQGPVELEAGATGTSFQGALRAEKAESSEEIPLEMEGLLSPVG
jgi:hypothetical protein